MQKPSKRSQPALALSCALASILIAGLIAGLIADWPLPAVKADKSIGSPAASPAASDKITTDSAGSLPTLQGAAAREYLERQGLYASLGEAMRAARYSINSQQAKLTASDAAAGDNFGSAVAISGETAVVGSLGDDDAGGNSGSVYVFVRTGTLWSQQQKLTASDAQGGDQFGSSVAINGETIVVGAPFDNPAGVFSGSAYVFKRTGTVWSEQQKLTASDAAAQDDFGGSVGISGETIVVGAYLDNDAGSNSGSAYVFVRTGTTWSQQQKLTAGDAAAEDLFGYSVAINGETIVVSAWLDDDAGGIDQGSAYVFVRAGTAWSQQAKLTAGDAAAGDRFGSVVAIDAETIVVGSPENDDAGGDSGSAYVFVRTGTVWSEQQKLTAGDAAAGDLFGWSVGISGETVVVGAHLDDDASSNSGSAYAFVRAGTVWSQQQKLTASDAAGGDRLGISVGISGEAIVVGASLDDDAGGSSGSAYVFAFAGPRTWAQQAKATASDAQAGDRFGAAIAISGETAVVGAPFDDNAGGNSGSAYVFVRTGTVWSQQQKLTASDAAGGDRFGWSVGIDAETIVVGAPNDDDAGGSSGSAYVFARTGTVWSQQQKLTASDAAADDWFGWSVGISGETIVVGALFDDDAGGNSGSAYVFMRTGAVWSQQQKLTASDAAGNDNFGNEVGISGETVVVGAPFDDNAGGSSGSAYVFVRTGTVWSQQQKLTASDAGAGDSFGSALAIDAETIVVGAQFDDDAGGNSGSAYVFVRTGAVWSQQQKLTASDAAGNDNFGYSVGISGETVVVSALQDADAGFGSGSAYVFVRTGAVWSQQQKLTASDAAAGDSFGSSAAIGGETIVIGASFDDDAGSDSGSAYVFVLDNPVLNSPPLITPAAITRQQGAAASSSQIATANDADQPLDTLTVTVDGGPIATSNGVTISGISVDASGAVAANVVADCTASNATFTLTVTDNQGDAANATLTVNVTANTPPALGDYLNTTVTVGGSATITPASPPSDNISISSVTVTAPGFTGAATVNPTTGVVSISGAGPVGGFLVSVKATDDCGAMTTKTFTLTVAADTCGIIVNPATLPQPYVGVPYARILSATPFGNYTFSVSAGQIPPGLQLVTVFGITSIAGLPATPGVYNFTIKAKKNNSECEATRSYTLTIPATVVPILECVQRNQNGSWTARFGYDNSTGAAAAIPVGSKNYFTPGSRNRGQATVFQPGRVNNAFSVTFSRSRGSNLAIWYLRGPDGVLRPVNVWTTSIGCP
ncbi:MAG: putative Ig domain-containing protein [Blastocatellales bacterium]